MLIQLEQNIVEGVRDRYGAMVAGATERFLALRRELGQYTLDHLVAMGRELLAVKKKLRYGKWQKWLCDDLGTDRRTAENIVAVAQAYESNAKTFSHFNSLDASRLYRLAQVSPEKLRQLSPDTPLPVKPGGEPKQLACMTAREFDAALDLFDPPRTGRRRPSKNPSVPGIPLPPLNPSNRELFALSFIAALEVLCAQAPGIRTLSGKLSRERKEAMEVEIEKLRKLILHWPAWAKKHR